MATYRYGENAARCCVCGAGFNPFWRSFDRDTPGRERLDPTACDRCSLAAVLDDALEAPEREAARMRAILEAAFTALDLRERYLGCEFGLAYGHFPAALRVGSLVLHREHAVASPNGFVYRSMDDRHETEVVAPEDHQWLATLTLRSFRRLCPTEAAALADAGAT